MSILCDLQPRQSLGSIKDHFPICRLYPMRPGLTEESRVRHCRSPLVKMKWFGSGAGPSSTARDRPAGQTDRPCSSRRAKEISSTMTPTSNRREFLGQVAGAAVATALIPRAFAEVGPLDASRDDLIARGGRVLEASPGGRRELVPQPQGTWDHRPRDYLDCSGRSGSRRASRSSPRGSPTSKGSSTPAAAWGVRRTPTTRPRLP